MRHTIVTGILLSTLLVGLCLSGRGFSASKETALDTSYLRVYAETRGFMLGRPVKPKPTPDGKAVLFLRSQPAAYEEASLLTYARELKRPLLLIHGTADDNVYFRHSLRLADVLFRNGR